MFSFEPTPLADAVLVRLPFSADDRGSFTKDFQKSIFAKEQLAFDLKESYYSFSRKDVIRGMHFQLPPRQHAKIVFCPVGRIKDVILDLRKASPTYKKFFSVTLSADNHLAMYVPEGFAHGFQTLEESSMTFYLVSSEYHPAEDTGVLWNSFGMEWGTDKPLLSARDRSFVALADFESPF